jgi:uncharacterized protein
MKYKFSLFNIITKHNDVNLLFNTRTLSLIEIDENIEELIKSEDVSSIMKLNKEDICLLYDNGFIVDKNTNEIDILKNIYWSEKINSKVLHLSVMTTLKCNFRCVYCFEKRSNLDMEVDVQDAIVKFIEKNIKDYDAIHIDWYGGEPLLNLNCIYNVSNQIINICKENNKEYFGTITTNGYNLTKEIVDKLLEVNVNAAQITLDGGKYIHDQRRILVSKEGTFDQIIENIIYAKKFMRIGIRVNIDKNSIDFVDELFEYLRKKDIKECPISVKGVVSSDENPCDGVIIPEEQFAYKVSEKNRIILENGLKTASLYIFDNITTSFCIVDSDSQFIISPIGKVYKCGESYDENDVGEIGKLLENGDMEIDIRKKVFWNKDPFEYEDCLKCKVLPMCMGGCQLKRKVKEKDWCNPELKYNIKNLIKMYYDILN